jgi:hypothetical protein
MLATIIKIISVAARPDILLAVKGILAVLARGKHLVNDKGETISPEELASLWAAARAEFQTLGDEAAASNAALNTPGR